MARYGKDLNENDIQKFFMTFDKTPYRNNQMFIVEGIDQVDEKTIPIVKYAVFDGTFTRPERMTHHELEKEIIEIPIPPNLIHLMREYVSSSLSVDERQAVQERGALGGRKKTRRYKRKSSKSRKQRGGTSFSETEIKILSDKGFFEDQIKELDDLNISFDDIMNKCTEITNRGDGYIGNPDDFNEQVINELKSDKTTGGRRRKIRKSRKCRKHRKSYKGGAQYGTGVGANCYDPNFSIYNTRELSLFPYRPTN
jgi:hypothetical protein